MNKTTSTKPVRTADLARKLSLELGMHVTLYRIYRYYERGILPKPEKGENGYSLFTEQDYLNLKTALILK